MTSPAEMESGKKFFGHPRGLSTLFFTEMWERFSYYGMRGILVLYLVNQVSGMGMSDAKAGAIYGMYTAGVYLLALPGGWIADRIIGQRRAVFVGGIIIAMGHFSMAMPSSVTFFLGLMLIVVGTGLLKPNVSAIVGDLYPEGGPRRDAGFSLFYMGINVGALAGPLIVGFLGENINWHLGFSAAGVGMVLGLIQYKMGLGHLGDAGHIRESQVSGIPQARRQLMIGIGVTVGILALIMVLQSLGVLSLELETVAQATGVIIVALAVSYFAYVLGFGGLDRSEKKRVVFIFFLFVGSALFWSGFEQAGSSLNLFAERLTDRNVFGFEAPASWLQSINPLFIIILAPVAGALWVKLGDRDPSIPVKFGAGLTLLGIGFFVLAWGATYTDGGNLVSPAWLVVTYFLHTTGELALSPVGLSSVTKLSPPRLVGQMMGIWFMGTALGNLIAGLVGGRMETLPVTQIFVTVGMFVLGSGLLFFVFSRPIKNLASDVR
ncbi:MAG: peptide MFS transporter [Gemmatimonadetes bacterium]|nr:peptide MFS transporter [Gemmatimonadota bacterium]